MPVSTLTPLVLDQLTPQQIADWALHADQEARRYARRGQHEEAEACRLEAERLCDLTHRK